MFDDFELCWQESEDGRGCYLGVYLHNGNTHSGFLFGELIQ